MSTAERTIDQREVDRQIDEGRERFEVTDTSSAEWALRKLAAIRDRQADVAETARAEIAIWHEWQEARNAELQRDADFFLGHLEGYARRMNETDPKTKTVKLPSGNLVLRKAPDHWDVEDDFLPWAIANASELVRTKVEPDKTAMKKLLVVGEFAEHDLLADVAEAAGTPTRVEIAKVVTADGEVVPDVTVMKGPVKFSAEVTR
jgi:hypothetical protein